MTDNNSSNKSPVYLSPEVKVLSVKTHHFLCGSLDGSPSNDPWDTGSESIGGLGGDE